MIDAARPLTTVPFARAPVGKAVAVAVTLLVVTQLASLHAFARAVDAA